MVQRRWLYVVGLALLCAGGALAQGALEALLPASKKLPAPDWLKPGVRLTYFSSAATIPGSYEHFVPDKDGNWVDNRTGERFSKSKTGDGQAGMGLTTVDVAAVDAAHSVLAVKSWLGNTTLDPRQPTIIPGPSTSCIGPPGVNEDWFVNPKALASLKPRREGGLTVVVPMPYKLGDTTYRAIGLEYRTDKARHSSIYDLDTGLLLSATGSVSTANDHTMLTNTKFLGRRQLPLPWLGNPPPPWVATVKGVDGGGTYTTYLPGSLPFGLTVRVTNNVVDRGPGWLRLDQTSVLTNPMQPGMPPTTSKALVVSGSAQLGGVWLPPAGLAALKPGQVLDTDALCGTQTVVAGTDGTYVCLRETGRVHTHDWIYELATGALARVRLEDRSLAMTVIDVRVGRRE